MKYLILPVLCVLAWTFPAFAQDDAERINCQIAQDRANPELVCDIRVGEPTAIRSATLLVNNEGRDGAEFIPFAETGQTSAWLFLIDRSNPARSDTVAKNVAFAKAMSENPGKNQMFGIATFASDLTVIVDVGDRNADLDRRLADVKADGAATEFFAAAIEGIKLLEQSGANRRALVMMSDGKAEDTAYNRADLVGAAKAAGVTIYGMGFAEKASETPDLQILRRLAEDTNGPFVSVISNDNVSLAFSENFKSYLENGGLIEADLSDVFGEAQINLTVALRDGSSYARTQSVFVQDAPVVEEPEPEPVPLSWIANTYTNFNSIAPTASVWAEANQGAAWAFLIGLPLVIILLIVFFILRAVRAGDQTENTEVDGIEEIEEPGTVPLSVEEMAELPVEQREMLGWFELVDDQNDRFEIRDMSVQIGRHSDSDFKLNNDSVHRHHAHFHYTPDMEPTITDLDTVNGVYVNGERVNSKKLASGDVVQLGEVRFRYYEH